MTQNCPAGTVNGANAATSCTPCGVGKFSLAGDATCSSCPAGTFAATVGSASCLPCPPGRYTAATGQAACTPCAAGTYQPLAGQQQCQTCAGAPAGSVSCACGNVPCQHGSCSVGANGVGVCNW